MSTVTAVNGPETASFNNEMKALDSDVIEVALLLPRWQALALMSAAKQRGMSAGQMLRRMIGATFGDQSPFANS